MLKLGTTMSLSSGTYTIASGHQMNSQQIMQMTQNNGNNINLIDLGKKLLDACKNGETEEVRNLMQSGAPFTTDWLGTSPLHFAAQYGHAETAELLLRAGVSRDTRTKVDRTPLHAAAQEGHLMIVSLLLLHGADVDAKDLLKMTPLHWAVERGHTDVVECLLTNGADVNLMSKFDKTPIDIALDTGRLDLIPLLQKYVNVSRPKPEVKQVVAPSSKLRPTVLPNKANRTTKTVKSTPPPPQQTNNVKQVFLPSNLGSLPKTVNLESLKKVLSSGSASHSNESSSSNVFAALAALAEATSGNSSNSISNEALQGLLAANAGDSENNDTLCQSALESGRQFSVTDGGKLALNSYAKEKNPSTTSSNSATNNSKIITIVAESSQLPQIISSTQATPIVLVSSSSLSDGVESQKRKQIKVTRPVNLPSRPQTTIQTLNKQINLTAVKDPVQDQVAKLQKELELMKKQAEEYKLQLKEKEKENSSLRQQLDAIKADSRQKSD